MFRSFILGLTALLIGSGATASTYYASTTGNDNNPGTISLPFRTITKGALKLKPGDTLYVRAGTYAESFIGNIPAGTSWIAPVTLAAYNGEAVTVKPGPSPESVFQFFGPEKYIIISGLGIDGTNTTGDCVKITNSSRGGAANHIEITGCNIFNAYQMGINITGGANYNLLYGTSVHNSALNGLKHSMSLHNYHGIYIATDNNTVQGCAVYHNSGYGIHCYSDSGTSVFNNTICGNRCYDNAVSGGYGAGILLSSGSGNIAYNNIVYANVYGICVDYDAVNTRVYNNTVYANRNYGIYLGSGSTGATVENNISYLNAWGPDIDNDGSHGSVFITNLGGVNPLFVNPFTYDFHLKTGSPAIGKGTVISGLTTDFDGKSRSAGPDIGAYER